MQCPDCGGSGKVSLLTSVSACKRCNGVGLLPDAPAMQSGVIPINDARAMASVGLAEHPQVRFNADGTITTTWTVSNAVVWGVTHLNPPPLGSLPQLRMKQAYILATSDTTVSIAIVYEPMVAIGPASIP